MFIFFFYYLRLARSTDFADASATRGRRFRRFQQRCTQVLLLRTERRQHSRHGKTSNALKKIEKVVLLTYTTMLRVSSSSRCSTILFHLKKLSVSGSHLRREETYLYRFYGTGHHFDVSYCTHAYTLLLLFLPSFCDKCSQDCLLYCCRPDGRRSHQRAKAGSTGP